MLEKYNIKALENSNAPTVATFHYPPHHNWNEIKKKLKENLIIVYDNVSYLEEKKLFQIGIMGFLSKSHIRKLLNGFEKALTNEK